MLIARRAREGPDDDSRGDGGTRDAASDGGSKRGRVGGERGGIDESEDENLHDARKECDADEDIAKRGRWEEKGGCERGQARRNGGQKGRVEVGREKGRDKRWRIQSASYGAAHGERSKQKS